MDVQDWMEGKPMEKPWFLKGRDAIVWSRSYSHPDERACNCDMLQQTLEDVGARRMVVGHTIQVAGVNGACDNQVIRCATPDTTPQVPYPGTATPGCFLYVAGLGLLQATGLSDSEWVCVASDTCGGTPPPVLVGWMAVQK